MIISKKRKAAIIALGDDETLKYLLDDIETNLCNKWSGEQRNNKREELYYQVQGIKLIRREIRARIDNLKRVDHGH